MQGAVGKKNLLPHLTHFKIENGEIRSFNGVLALCSPIKLDINAVPNAITFYKAIQNCDENVTITMDEDGKLAVGSGKRVVYVECVGGETGHVEPEGDVIQLDDVDIVGTLKKVRPFIGDDASRPWSNGVLFDGKSAFATNNISIIEVWLDVPFPTKCVIPLVAIKEMIRIKDNPTHMQMTADSVTFHYEGDKWLRTSTINDKWPDVRAALNVSDHNATAINPELFEGVEFVKQFGDNINRVYMIDGELSTSVTLRTGATYKIDDCDYNGTFQAAVLNSLEHVATTIDFNSTPCVFFGDKCRGALIGMKT